LGGNLEVCFSSSPELPEIERARAILLQLRWLRVLPFCQVLGQATQLGESEKEKVLKENCESTG
jgi:hypothetical protein